ncbi:VCBS domain-containing protein [Paraglaciecola aquimarina]|uniref:VCBS domain-containing protein n=1 Tax=Paraglaciecola aquimarina TaxID=1235557 RepID=A0ABU3SUY4_9ALTE|nr:VCBS domain-containing protein [Paraglaciecola aquimarina]MDU0353772.1 VCBS domain-containing protein [Paraglaciecola aquimarina]
MKLRVFTLCAICAALTACSDDSVTGGADNTVGSVAISGTAVVGETLSATVTDADTASNVSYQWLAEGAPIAGATSSTYVLASAQVGNTVSVKAVYTDELGYTEGPLSSATSTVYGVANNTSGAVTISGDAAVGETLTAAVTDAEGVTGNITYSWMADGVAISGATSMTYIPTTDDVGKTITVMAHYADDAAYDESVTSTATSAVLLALNKVGVVGISGELTVGKTLTASITDDNGVSGTTVYSWLADGEIIDGETSATLLLTTAMNGLVITVTAVYTDDDGFVENLTSSPTGAVRLENSEATFAGLSTNVTNNQGTHTGVITVTDVDPGDELLISQTDTATSYGTFSIQENGSWTYSLDTTDATIAGLANASDSVDDEIIVESLDGTIGLLVVTITGSTVVNTKAAIIRDTLGETVQGTSNDGDTGELRYVLPAAQLTGKLSVSFNKAANTTNINPQDTDTDNKDAYITLFNSANSTSSSRAIADLRIQTNKFVLRDQTIDIANAFNPDTWQNVEITCTSGRRYNSAGDHG